MINKYANIDLMHRTMAVRDRDYSDPVPVFLESTRSLVVDRPYRTTNVDIIHQMVAVARNEKPANAAIANIILASLENEKIRKCGYIADAYAALEKIGGPATTPIRPRYVLTP